MIRVGLIGGRGYVGQELLQLLDPMPEYQVVFAGSRSAAGKPVATEFAGIDSELVFSDLQPETIRSCPADAWVLAQDNGQAAGLVELLDGPETRIIDISADFRLDDNWVYGIPQANAAQIAATQRVANPGCYATAIQLGLLPILNRLDATPPVAFGVSGYSGAGRTPSEKNDPDRLQDNLLPYALAGHGHERETSHQLGRDIRFTPHVASFFRGISITLSMTFAEPTDPQELARIFQTCYEPWPLVETGLAPPEIAAVRLTNRAAVGGFAVDQRDPRRVTLVSVIDNLRKGAASQAIENLNLMFGLPSTTGLLP